MEILEALSLWIGQEAKPWLVQEVRKGNTKRIPVIESLYVVGSCTMLFYVVVPSFLFSPILGRNHHSACNVGGNACAGSRADCQVASGAR